MIAILSNLNMEPLRSLLAPDPTYCSGFNQLLPDLLDARSPAYHPSVKAALVFVDGEQLLGEALDRLPDPAGLARARADLDQILAALESYARQLSPAPVVVANLALPPARFTGDLEANSGLSFADWEAELNRDLAARCGQSPNLVVLDWRNCLLAEGWRQLCDQRFFYLARVKLTKRGLDRLRDEFRRLIDAYHGTGAKALVVDLDNTLWGGVVGEEGIGGIVLSEDGAGKAYRDFQRALQSAQQLGILLAISSKNNPADALEAIANHPHMILRRDDFAGVEIGWTDKAAQLRSLAAQLGLDVGALVFIDDSAVERELIRDALPAVAVPEFPADPAELRSWLLGTVLPRYFGRLALTAEDRARTAQYRARQALQSEAAAHPRDLEGFLEGLQSVVDVRHDQPSDRQRVAQLTQKTNQFNFTTRRYTEAEIAELIAAADVEVSTVRYVDRFGDEGIVGAAITRDRLGATTLDTFLLSCRVIGRRVEHRFLAALAQRALERGSQRLVVEFLPTARNAPAAQFVAALGLADAGGGRRERPLAELIEQLRAAVGPRGQDGGNPAA